VPPRRRQDPPLDDSADVLAAMRAEVGRLRSGLARLEEGLSALERAQHQPAGAVRDRPERYLRVLVDVYERGGQHRVDADGLAAIGRAYGYDPRGLGGFFTGSRAPLRRADGRVTLTRHGEQLVDVYLRPLDT